MSITGTKFLELNRADTLIATPHALMRLKGAIGRCSSMETLSRVFLTAHQLKSREMRLLGYSPNYHGRLKRKIKSWYFLAMVDDIEIIFVVTESQVDGSLVWVTTYTPNRQNAQYALCSHEELKYVA